MVVAFSQTQHVPGERHECRGCVRRSKALNVSELQFFFFFVWSLYYLRQSLAMSPGLASHSQPSCSSLSRAGIASLHHGFQSQVPSSGKWRQNGHCRGHLRDSKESWRWKRMHRADAHEKCGFLSSFLPGILLPWKTAELWLSHATAFCLGLHTACSASQQLGAGYNRNRGWLRLNNFYHWCFLESLCESEIINKIG